ncbi:hypothetical protein [Streptomyces gibsoniae]|uniref:Uncharacterized protein n=1 Tax=Streptomyces gibsoniae TaxID=3075529 RepID=A0ABU2TWU5_9ACTN|nr:hypothetical protein [Streptomyces sp. DSM 41699]MDT0465437.1 hypothetical protein [Streptomyces sp. DSM 41699]
MERWRRPWGEYGEGITGVTYSADIHHVLVQLGMEGRAVSGRWAVIDRDGGGCCNDGMFSATFLVIRAHIDFGRVWSAACR